MLDQSTLRGSIEQGSLDLVGVGDQAQGCEVVADVLPKVFSLDLKVHEVWQSLQPGSRSRLA